MDDDESLRRRTPIDEFLLMTPRDFFNAFAALDHSASRPSTARTSPHWRISPASTNGRPFRAMSFTCSRDATSIWFVPSGTVGSLIVLFPELVRGRVVLLPRRCKLICGDFINFPERPSPAFEEVRTRNAWLSSSELSNTVQHKNHIFHCRVAPNVVTTSCTYRSAAKFSF